MPAHLYTRLPCLLRETTLGWACLMLCSRWCTPSMNWWKWRRCLRSGALRAGLLLELLGLLVLPGLPVLLVLLPVSVSLLRVIVVAVLLLAAALWLGTVRWLCLVELLSGAAVDGCCWGATASSGAVCCSGTASGRVL
jgi:hypothetical protein